MPRRSFTVHEAAGCQRRAIAIINAPGRAMAVCTDLDAGDYTVRDCLGGLRLRFRVNADGSEPTVLEVTK